MKEAHDRAYEILSAHRDQMDLMATVLLWANPRALAQTLCLPRRVFSHYRGSEAASGKRYMREHRYPPCRGGEGGS